MKVLFTPEGWEDYTFWQERDRKLAKRLNRIIKDMRRDPFSGIAKPEALKRNYSGFWSRRLTDEHRIVYRVKDENLEIVACRGHYGD
jgi:toxin YoeB